MIQKHELGHANKIIKYHPIYLSHAWLDAIGWTTRIHGRIIYLPDQTIYVSPAKNGSRDFMRASPAGSLRIQRRGKRLCGSHGPLRYMFPQKRPLLAANRFLCNGRDSPLHAGPKLPAFNLVGGGSKKRGLNELGELFWLRGIHASRFHFLFLAKTSSPDQLFASFISLLSLPASNQRVRITRSTSEATGPWFVSWWWSHRVYWSQIPISLLLWWVKIIIILSINSNDGGRSPTRVSITLI